MLPIWCIRPSGRSQLRLPFIPICQQLLLVIQQLLSRFGGILGIRTLDDSIDWTTFLAEAAVDAFSHINVVASGTTRAVLALFGLNSDGAGGTDGFTELASNATFFAGGIAAQGVFATETGGDGAFFKWVVDCVSIGTSDSCRARQLLVGKQLRGEAGELTAGERIALVQRTCRGTSPSGESICLLYRWSFRYFRPIALYVVI